MATPITPKLIQELRQRTGAGMMDCKKALEETGGDIDQAVENLRKRGIAKAEKRVGRAASEGRIVGRVVDGGKAGILVEVNSETDFVSRNEEFGALAQAVSQQVERDQSLDEAVGDAAQGTLLGQPWHADAATTVGDAVKAASGKTGENIVVRRYARIAARDGVIGAYVHHNGRVGVLVEVTGGGDDAARQLASSVAEHIAAGVPTVPRGVTRDDIPTEFVDRERSIFEAQAREQGKPENIIEKIVKGQIEKIYKENTLLDQPWVRDDSKTIRQLAEEAGAGVTVRRFVRFQMGEE